MRKAIKEEFDAVIGKIPDESLHTNVANFCEPPVRSYFDKRLGDTAEEALIGCVALFELYPPREKESDVYVWEPNEYKLTED